MFLSLGVFTLWQSTLQLRINLIYKMTRHWYYIFIFAIAFSFLPRSLRAGNMMKVEEVVAFNDINIYYEQNSLRVTGGEGLKLRVFNVAGILVVCENVDSADKRYNLDLPRGCYIVKVGSVVKKIFVK